MRPLKLISHEPPVQSQPPVCEKTNRRRKQRIKGAGKLTRTWTNARASAYSQCGPDSNNAAAKCHWAVFVGTKHSRCAMATSTSCFSCARCVMRQSEEINFAAVVQSSGKAQMYIFTKRHDMKLFLKDFTDTNTFYVLCFSSF